MARMRDDENHDHDEDAGPIECARPAPLLDDRRRALLRQGVRNAATDVGGAGGGEGFHHAERAAPSIDIMVVVVSPTTCQSRRVGGGDDRGEVADGHGP